jgi:hypothetical protein
MNQKNLLKAKLKTLTGSIFCDLFDNFSKTFLVTLNLVASWAMQAEWPDEFAKKIAQSVAQYSFDKIT